MAVVRITDESKVFDSHRKELIRLMEEIDARAGIGSEPIMTAEELRQSMLASGIRPEDNILSREIIRMRYGDDEDGE